MSNSTIKTLSTLTEYPTVVIPCATKINNRQYSLVRCIDCGKLRYASTYCIVTGKADRCTSCGYKYRHKKYLCSINRDKQGDTINGIEIVTPYIASGKGGNVYHLFRCPVCGGVFKELRTRVFTGKRLSCGCTTCSSGESRCRKELTLYGILYETETKFVDLTAPLTGAYLRFDFKIYKKDGTFFLLEYQGVQHYVDTGKLFSDYERRITDNLKKMYCINKGIPLYEVGYKEDISRSMSYILIKEGLLKLIPKNC